MLSSEVVYDIEDEYEVDAGWAQFVELMERGGVSMNGYGEEWPEQVYGEDCAMMMGDGSTEARWDWAHLSEWFFTSQHRRADPCLHFRRSTFERT